MNEASRNRIGWLVLRIHLAGLVAAHGYYRLLTGGTAGFGQYLELQDLPFGLAIEYSVLLVVALLCVGLQHLPGRKGARP